MFKYEGSESVALSISSGYNVDLLLTKIILRRANYNYDVACEYFRLYKSRIAREVRGEYDMSDDAYDIDYGIDDYIRQAELNVILNAYN